MALVQRSADRYNSAEHRSLGASSSRSSRPSPKKYNHYEARNADDSNNSSLNTSAVDSASHRNKKNKSSIPIRQGAVSPPKLSSPNRKQEEPNSRNLFSNHSHEAGQSEDSDETPKLKRKVRKRLERKPKRRNNAIVGQDYAGRNGKKSYHSGPGEAGTGKSGGEDLFDKNRAAHVSVTNHSPVVSVARPLKITYRPSTSIRDDSIERHRSRNERPKTLPITFTVRSPIKQEAKTEAADDSDEDTLTSGGESSEEENERRTSIRIVSSSARSSEAEESIKKLHIEAKSFKRSRKKSEEFISERESGLTQEDAIYIEKARDIINRNQRERGTRKQTKLQRVQLQDAEATVNYARTLPRNFKTVRVPIQTQASPEKENRNFTQRRSSQPINLRGPKELPTQPNDHRSLRKSPSASSTQSNDLSPTNHRCKRGCTHVVDDTVDGPRIIRRPREDRRKSNPNQILGRTEIQGLNKGRPKSEIARSSSLPRSSDRPRIKSTAFEEFVEINDLSEFSRSKSRTLPYRKKRVTYHEGVKDDAYAFSESEVHSEEFQRHLLIHQNFTEKAHKRLSSVTDQEILNSEGRDRAADRQEAQGRAHEIEHRPRGYANTTTSTGFQDVREVRSQSRKVDTAQVFEAARQKKENYKQDSDFKQAKAKLQEVRSQESDSQNSRGEKGRRVKHSSFSEEENQVKYLEENSQEKQQTEKKVRKVVKEEAFQENFLKERELSKEEKEEKKREGKIVTRSKTLPRKGNRGEYEDQRQQEFEEFIRNQRNLLLNQLYKREKGQEAKVQGQSSIDQKVRSLEGKRAKEVQEDPLVERKIETENSGRLIDDFLVFPNASKNKRRHKSTNDAQSISEAKFIHQNQYSTGQKSKVTVQRSQSSAVKSRESEEHSKERPQFLLQNNQEPKTLEKNTDIEEEIVKVFSRGGVIKLTMESIDQERFEQRQREYEALQKRRSMHRQDHREINDERYRYMNNEFDAKNNGFYYNEQRYDPGKRHVDTYYGNENFMWNDDVFEEQRDTPSTQMTKVTQEQMHGKLDKVHYTICTHYFYPEDHDLIVNLHRLGKIEVPRGLSHKDTCIFYNHLYVYEKEEVFAETLAPIMPKIKTEVVNLEEQIPEYETMSENSSANQSYNDDTSSQYSSSSRRERNLFSSLKAQKYYDAKQNNNNEDSVDFGFDSTYETLRRKRKSYNDDDDLNRYGAISPGSSSGKSDFTYSKPRLLRRSEEFPGVGREVEDDYPRWTPKSPTPRERDYGLSVALPP